jgi:hypothetical protein
MVSALASDMVVIQNSKLEYRNSKQIRNLKLEVSHFELVSEFDIRISDFVHGNDLRNFSSISLPRSSESNSIHSSVVWP